MTGRLRTSIVVIGDEILGGFVQDTNSGWLAQRLHGHGIPLDRVITVPDDLEAIREALLSELARSRPRLVLTSGGIGSTPDDLTFEAVAATLGVGLSADPELDRRIDLALERTARFGVEISPEHELSMRKMSRVPDGAYLLEGAQGIAAGVAVDVDGGLDGSDGATVVILPGIPGELQRIFADSIAPTLLARRGTPHHVVELQHGYPESALNPVLDRIVAEFPDVHLGSYPGRECTIRLKGAADRVEAAADLVRAYLREVDASPGAVELRNAWQSRW